MIINNATVQGLRISGQHLIEHQQRRPTNLNHHHQTGHRQHHTSPHRTTRHQPGQHRAPGPPGPPHRSQPRAPPAPRPTSAPTEGYRRPPPRRPARLPPRPGARGPPAPGRDMTKPRRHHLAPGPALEPPRGYPLATVRTSNCITPAALPWPCSTCHRRRPRWTGPQAPSITGRTPVM